MGSYTAGVLTERRLGELLKVMPKATGMLKRGSVVPVENHGNAPTLSDVSIDKKTSMRTQRLAALQIIN